MAFSLIGICGFIIAVCISIRAAFVVWLLGGAAIPVALALVYPLAPNADRGAAVCGFTAAFAIGGAAGTLIRDRSHKRVAATSRSLLTCLLNIVIALVTEALPLLAVVGLIGPYIGSTVPENDIALKLSISSAAIAFAVGLGGYSFFAAWIRARGVGTSSKNSIKMLFWVFAGAGLGPAAVALGYAGSDTGLPGIAIGLLVGSLVGGVFAVSWNLARETLGPLTSALSGALVTAGVPVLVLFAKFVAANTVQQRWALVASIAVMLPTGFALEAAILTKRASETSL